MIKHATLSLCTNLTEQDMFEYYCHLPFISNYSKAIHSFLTVCSQKGVATVNMLSWVKLCGFSVIEQKGTATQKWTVIVEQDFVLTFIICHAVSIHTGAFPSSQLLIVVNLMNQACKYFYCGSQLSVQGSMLEKIFVMPFVQLDSQELAVLIIVYV